MNVHLEYPDRDAGERPTIRKRKNLVNFKNLIQSIQKSFIQIEII